MEKGDNGNGKKHFENIRFLDKETCPWCEENLTFMNTEGEPVKLVYYKCEKCGIHWRVILEKDKEKWTIALIED